jgi:hypothetical protein
MNIFEHINLNGTSSKDLQSLVDIINKNFQKVSSLPFLKGDKGTNVDIVEESLVIINKTTKKITGVTEFGKLVFAAYYGKEYTKEEKDTDDIFSKQSLRVLLDNSTGNKYLLIPQLLGKAYYVTGTYDSVNTKWALERHNILPQIIYDKEKDISTWEIDGINTGINANGEAGSAGKSIRCWTANGVTKPIGDYLNKIDIVNFYTPYFTLKNDPNKEYSTDTYIEKGDPFYYYDADNNTQDLNDDTLKPADGDLVAIYLKKGLNDDKLTISIPNVVFGILRTDVSGQYYVIFNNNNLLSVGDLLSEYKIQNLLNHTGIHDNQDKPTDFTRGLYTYPKFNESPLGSPHMFWATEGDEIVTRLGVLKNPDQVNSTAENPLLLKDGHTKLHLEYPTTYLRNAIFTNETDDNGYLKPTSVFSVDTSTDSKNNYLLTATNKNLIANFNNISNTDSSANSIKLSQDSVKFNTTDDLKAYIIPSFTIKYEQDSNNDLRIKNSTVVNLGGEYSFSLPYLGYKTKTGKEIFNATQFTRLDKSTDPLKISLHEVELNHNGESSDNTGFGWRSFYDVDLLSSPCSYNSNREVCVYVGSSECDIINSDKYKLKITVIQYRVAYDNGTLYKYKSDTNSGSEYLKEADTKTLRTVTEVIYYLIEPDDKVKFNCLRYRLFFNNSVLTPEATNTIYIEPIKDETNNIIDAAAINYNGNSIATYQSIVTSNIGTFAQTYKKPSNWETDWDNIDNGVYNGELSTGYSQTTYNQYLISDNNIHKQNYKINILKRLNELGYFPSYNTYNDFPLIGINDTIYNRGFVLKRVSHKSLNENYYTFDCIDTAKNVLMNSLYDIKYYRPNDATTGDENIPNNVPADYQFDSSQFFDLAAKDNSSLKRYLRMMVFSYLIYYDTKNSKYALYSYKENSDILSSQHLNYYWLVNATKANNKKKKGEIDEYIRDIKSRYSNLSNLESVKSEYLKEVYEEQDQMLDHLIELLKEKSELEYKLICIETSNVHTLAAEMQSVQPQYTGFKWVNGKFNDSENKSSGPGSGVLLPSTINSDSKTTPEFLYPLNKTTSLNSIENFYNISFTTDKTTNTLSNKGFLDITVGDYTLHKVCKDISINNKKVLTEEIPTSFSFVDSNSTIQSNIDSVINTTINTGGLIPSTIKA